MKGNFNKLLNVFPTLLLGYLAVQISVLLAVVLKHPQITSSNTVSTPDAFQPRVSLGNPYASEPIHIQLSLPAVERLALHLGLARVNCNSNCIFTLQVCLPTMWAHTVTTFISCVTIYSVSTGNILAWRSAMPKSLQTRQKKKITKENTHMSNVTNSQNTLL